MVPLCFDDSNLFQQGTKDCERPALHSQAGAITGIMMCNRGDKSTGVNLALK